MVENISIRKIVVCIALFFIVVGVFAFLRSGLDHSFFVKLLFDDANEFAHKGVITSNFMPIGYSGFLGFCMSVGGTSGIPFCQSVLYAGILCCALWFLWLRNLPGLTLFCAVVLIALHPVLVLNVWRIHDGNLTALLLLGFLAAGISFIRRKNIWSVIAFGIFAGLLFTVRTNAILLVFTATWLFLRKNVEERDRKAWVRNTLIFFAGLVITTIVITGITRGEIFFFGTQGPYNLFAGSNEYSSKYLLSDYSGENSLGEALRARGFSSVHAFSDVISFPSDTYTKLAVQYITQHPFEYAKLFFLKLFTLFRPGYHIAGETLHLVSSESLKWFLKFLLALPVFIWIYFVYKARKRFFDTENLFVFSVIVLYILPFLFANADPRYRFPLDIVFIADSFVRAKQQLRA